MGCEKNKADIYLYWGDDTNFLGVNPITIEIETELDVAGCTATFAVQSVTKTFTAEEVATKKLVVNYSAEETSSFYPGKCYGTFTFYDTEGRKAVKKIFIVDVLLHSTSGKIKSEDTTVSVAIDPVLTVGNFRNYMGFAIEKGIPDNPKENTIYFDEEQFKIWDGTQWRELNQFLLGETIKNAPTQRELAAALKTVWEKRGGTVAE